MEIQRLQVYWPKEAYPPDLDTPVEATAHRRHSQNNLHILSKEEK